MITALVRGTVVASSEANEIKGGRYYLVQPCNQAGEAAGDIFMAVDTVSSRRGDVVLVSKGSSARQTSCTVNKPVDAVIVGIVDQIEENGKVIYKR